MKVPSKPQRVRLQKFFVWAIGLVMLIPACYPGGPESIDQLSLVVTLFDNQGDFQQFRTYVMPDSVIHVVGDNDTMTISRAFDDSILVWVERNMTNYNWVRLPDTGAPETPDVALLVYATVSDNWIGFVSYPWWPGWGWYPGWGYWPPCCGPGWGWGYPCCGSVQGVNYQTGTVGIGMFNPADVDTVNKVLPNLWGGALNGVLTDDASRVEQGLKNGIDQAYAQSPYLRLNTTTP